jgi:hypothetical protein
LNRNGLQILDLTRFLDANRAPLRLKTLQPAAAVLDFGVTAGMRRKRSTILVP